MKSNIGIWLDRKQAVLMRLSQSEEEVLVLESPVEPYHIKGGARSKVPYGPQDNVSEQKFLNRYNQQLADYFETIMAHITHAGSLYIFGPGETKIALVKAIRSDYSFKDIPLKMETADSMTQNQMVAQVKDFFKVEK